MFMPAKSPFGDCGGNITDSENGFIKSPNYPEKYTTNDQSEWRNIFCVKTLSSLTIVS